MDQALARPVRTAAGFAGQPLLSVENLSVTYGAVQAVRDLDLVIGAGEIVTLLGANGAGKSSTLKAIVGLAPAAAAASDSEHATSARCPRKRSCAPGSRSCPRGAGCFRT